MRRDATYPLANQMSIWLGAGLGSAGAGGFGPEKVSFLETSQITLETLRG